MLSDAERLIGEPFTQEGLIKAFHDNGSFSKHLLAIYSLAIGCSARMMAEIGIGTSTRALLAAAQTTNGRLYSCSTQPERHEELLNLYPVTKRWRLSLAAPLKFATSLPEPLDFVLHRDATDSNSLEMVLDALLPRMRQFGIIVIHDTQHPHQGRALSEGVRRIASRHEITSVTLPYSGGLTVVRVEESAQPPIVPAGRFKGSRLITEPFSTGNRITGMSV